MPHTYMRTTGPGSNGTTARARCRRARIAHRRSPRGRSTPRGGASPLPLWRRLTVSSGAANASMPTRVGERAGVERAQLGDARRRGRARSSRASSSSPHDEHVALERRVELGERRRGDVLERGDDLRAGRGGLDRRRDRPLVGEHRHGTRGRPSRARSPSRPRPCRRARRRGRPRSSTAAPTWRPPRVVGLGGVGVGAGASVSTRSPHARGARRRRLRRVPGRASRHDVVPTARAGPRAPPAGPVAPNTPIRIAESLAHARFPHTCGSDGRESSSAKLSGHESPRHASRGDDRSAAARLRQRTAASRASRLARDRARVRRCSRRRGGRGARRRGRCRRRRGWSSPRRSTVVFSGPRGARTPGCRRGARRGSP